MKIGTYNIRIDNWSDWCNKSWRSRKYGVTDIIRKNDLDIVAVQEVNDIFQKWGLMCLLPGYDYYGMGRDSKGGFWGEQIGILWKKDKFDVLDRGRFFLSSTPNVPSNDWGEYITQCVWVKFSEFKTNKTFYFLCTHYNSSSDYQIKATNLILTKLKEIGAKDKTPIILGGDFNLRSWQNVDAYNLLSTNFDDANVNSLVKNNDTIGTGAGFTNVIPPIKDRIDYIFTKNITLNEVNTITDVFNGIFPSDHLPVILNCNI